ncbi:MAG: WecB/TagA/CpsF family glycosyltransferase [Brumimicrobium sp.]
MKSEYLNGIHTYGFSDRDELIHFAASEKKSLIAINAEKILNSTPQLSDLINQNIGYTDGMGAVWALKRKGVQNVQKIPGCELWLDIIKAFYRTKSFYLVGAKEETIQETVQKLRSEFPGIYIAGYRNGYIKSEEEKNLLINDISEKKPDVVFVAMGSPKQELLIQEMLQNHRAIYQGLGGSFDVYTGHVQRAPDIWIKLNLEWAYRLFKEPKRILRQSVLVKFVYRLVTNKL